MTMFNKLYAHYKDDFDYEMLLKESHTTYADAYIKAQQAEEWF